MPLYAPLPSGKSSHRDTNDRDESADTQAARQLVLCGDDVASLRCTPLIRDRYVLMAPVGHSLLHASLKSVHISDLAGHPYIGLTSDTLIGRVLSATDAFPMNVREPLLRVSNTSLLCGAIQNGSGISILTSLSTRFLNMSGIESRLLVKPTIERVIQMFKRPQRSMSPAAQLVWEEIAHDVKNLPETDGVSRLI